MGLYTYNVINWGLIIENLGRSATRWYSGILSGSAPVPPTVMVADVLLVKCSWTRRKTSGTYQKSQKWKPTPNCSWAKYAY